MKSPEQRLNSKQDHSSINELEQVLLFQQEFKLKANQVKEQIEKDFDSINEEELENFFDKFKNDKGTIAFLEYYNRSVLDREKINFGEFKSRWGIQGMTREVIAFFNEHFDQFKKEIIAEKDIKKFFEKYCCRVRRESSFCSKLFHTILPNEFPPVDNPIKRKFNLQREDFILSVLIIRAGYKLFFEQNPEKINQIRNILSKPKFAYLRVDELSDIRILDMYYWFKENKDL